MDDKKDKSGLLFCHRCQQGVPVKDDANDKISKMAKEEAEALLEDEAQVGKTQERKNIVEIYTKLKCRSCDRFTCQKCLELCSLCNQ